MAPSRAAEPPNGGAPAHAFAGEEDEAVDHEEDRRGRGFGQQGPEPALEQKPGDARSGWTQ